MQQQIKVMLVDDHAVVRAGYRMLLKGTPFIEVVREASSGEAACREYRDCPADVVIMDLSLPGMGGLEAIRRIISRDNSAKILVFSMHEDIVFVEQAIQAGARGYLTKKSAPQLLVEAVQKLANGEPYIDPELARIMAYEKSRGQGSPLSDLSTREFEIFCMLAEGMKTTEIAGQLSLGYKTVANYSSQIKSKLEATSNADIARLAIRYNIIRA